MKKIYFLLFLLVSGLGINAQDSMNCEVDYHWKDSTIVGSFFFDNAYNEIWGFAQDNQEYAIIGTTLGTHIFDVTDPDNASEIHFIEGEVTGGNIVHRDYHDYEGYLYIVCDEGPSTLQIVDISNLPESVDVAYDSNDLFSRSHNIFIDRENVLMYVCGGNTTLNVYSLENPIDPELIIDCDEDVENWDQIGYVHDIYVTNGIAYCNAGEDGFFIVDFTDPAAPQVLGSLTDYEESGYNHSGWLHEGGDIYALADETHGTRVKILDVSDPTDIQILSLIGSDITFNSIPHNLIFIGDYLHVSYYYDGYYVFDVSDPENPFLQAFYDTSEEPNFDNYKGAWGVYPFLPSGRVLVSDMQEGLFVMSPNLDADNTNEYFEQTGVTIYPNPIENDNVINLDGLNIFQGEVEYQVLNQLGQTIDGGMLSSESKSKIFLKELNTGIYYLNLSSKEQQMNYKFVKK